MILNLFALGMAAAHPSILMDDAAFVATYPDAPPAAEFKKGVEIYAQGKGLDRVLMGERKGIGSWFDGKIRRDVEDVWRLTPELMARWLGYLAGQEKQAPEQVSERWVKIKENLEGNHWFVVRLSAFPKLDLLDGYPSDSVDSSSLENVRFQITLNGRKLPRSQTFDATFGFVPRAVQKPISLTDVAYLRANVLSGPTVQTRHWKEIDAFTWLEETSLGNALLPEFRPNVLQHAIPIGEYYAKWYLLSVPVRPEPAKTIEVWVFRPKKQAMASWDY